MDYSLEVLHNIIIYLHILTVIAIILKIVLVFRSKGFDVPAVVSSFFRVYTKSDLYMSNNQSRKQYMRLNNLINYYIYGWLLATIIIIVVFHSPY
ncbi:hypothetical protein FRZ67_00370 [Panacibacter ginsenosidivorans]|uniref:Uncharacterized protein n=1 Tax=Panacibacter ginsenosidivorans TaxID=1813871 RepID=A0A5B8V3T1_9BACT|nr:hypothetical protein [Panacibacter ginsenosidivorans]QEC65829.1 hypothetical protein FRZ67_00370 [Panacibacter ginsenosidivorans]